MILSDSAAINAPTVSSRGRQSKMKVAFLHPDLGIGGAERLVVDGAIALQNKGHDVTIFTSHHDPAHCFDETREGTLKVEVYGNTVFPRHIVGRFSILFATLRQLHLVQSLVKKRETYDLFIIDQLPAAIPYLRVNFPEARILFYCHHPDLLLTERGSIIKKVYRYPFDTFERWTTSLSDQIAVNSKYTRKVFFQTFGKKNMPDPDVVYPVVDVVEAKPLQEDNMTKDALRKLAPFCEEGDRRVLLSINRFERKKNIDLAIASYSLLLHAHADSRNHLLIIAGGYDTRVRENIEYLQELQNLASKFRVPHTTIMPGESWSLVNFEKSRILFLPSVSSSLRDYLLGKSVLLLYTPTNEHFGIVPLEAMKAQTPVLATNTGGPLETVVDGVTGWLREPDMEAWYLVIREVLTKMTRAELAAIGEAGRTRVLEHFTLRNLEDQLNNLSLKTVETPRKSEVAVVKHIKRVTLGIVAAVLLVIALALGGAKAAIFILHYVAESRRWNV